MDRKLLISSVFVLLVFICVTFWKEGARPEHAGKQLEKYSLKKPSTNIKPQTVQQQKKKPAVKPLSNSSTAIKK